MVMIDIDKFKNDRTPLPEVETVIEDKPKLPDWVGPKFSANKKTGRETVDGKEQEHKNRSEAMKGNKNAAGEHNYIGKLMTGAEFNKLYGKNITQEEIDVWKTTDVDGLVNMDALTSDLKKYVEKSGNYVQDLAGNWEHIANFQSGNIAKKLEQLEIDYTDKNDPDYIKGETIYLSNKEWDKLKVYAKEKGLRKSDIISELIERNIL